MKNIEAYCETAFLCMNATLKKWGAKDYYRPISRIFYQMVFDTGVSNATGLISEKALNNKIKRLKVVFDHYLSPQFVGRMIMDNPDQFLTDYAVFRELFYLCCQVICVTQQENDELSFLTKNDGDTYVVKVPTYLKYNHLGIKLYKRPDGVRFWKEATEIETNVLSVTEALTAYERRFLVTK